MYARSTTVQAQSTAIDAGVADIRDHVLPALLAMPGCVGLSLMVDRESGRCIATSAWETAAAMHDRARQVRSLREDAARAFGGRTAVDEWEIAVLHRGHHAGDGACVRATWLRIQSGQFDRAVDYYRTAVLSAIEELDGFCSASLMINRESGVAVSSTSFDSAAAMDRNRDRARSLRTERLRDLGADQIDVGEFELAIARLRVPEMV